MTRRLWSLGAAALMAAMVSTPAQTAPYPVNATLSVTLGELGSLALTGSGVGTSDGRFLAASLPAGVIDLASTASLSISPPILDLSLITVAGGLQNHAGSFVPGGGSGGGLGGDMGNTGIASFFFTNGGAAGAIPLNAVGGGTSMTIMGSPLTVVGAIWTDLGVDATTPTRTIQVMEAPAGIPSTITGTAFDHRTAGGLGTVQLVAPGIVKIFMGNLGNLPIVGTLKLQFVPEPGMGLLVGSGLVGLVAMGRRHRSTPGSRSRLQRPSL